MHMVEFFMYFTQRKVMLDKQFYLVITFLFLHLQIKQIDFHLEVIY